MTTEECYEIIGSYSEAIKRFGNETRIRKYLDKFCKDATFASLCEALDAEDYQQAFLCVHNLKGLYLNLAMTHVGRSASALCEALRKGKPTEDISGLITQVQEDHSRTIAAIKQLLHS